MRAAFLATIALLAGCANTTVQDMSNGQHSLTATAESGGVAGSHEEAVEQANDYCARSGQQAVIGSFYDQAEVGARGEHTSTIIFSCAAARTLRF
jgi:predicted small secreted protein